MDTTNKTAWLCVTKQCHSLGSRLCYSLPTSHLWQHCALSKVTVAVSVTMALRNLCCCVFYGNMVLKNCDSHADFKLAVALTVTVELD
jgi:hypothetical protein